jgi:Retrotransposon gag protein
VAFFLSCLSSSALSWANYVVSSDETLFEDFPRFLDLFKAQFTNVLSKSTAAFELRNSKQNSRRVSEYTSEFLSLACLTEHNEFSLHELYESNLDFAIQQAFALLNPYPDTILKMSQVAARIDETNFPK